MLDVVDFIILYLVVGDFFDGAYAVGACMSVQVSTRSDCGHTNAPLFLWAYSYVSERAREIIQNSLQCTCSITCLHYHMIMIITYLLVLLWLCKMNDNKERTGTKTKNKTIYEFLFDQKKRQKY